MGFDLQAHQELRRLSYQVNCLVRDFCCRAKKCIGISNTGDPNLVLNQQGDWVQSSAISIGNPVNGDPNEFLYTDTNGNLYQDGLASRDSVTNETYIGYRTGAGQFTNAFHLGNILGGALSDGAAFQRHDAVNDNFTFIGTVDMTPFGGSTNALLGEYVDFVNGIISVFTLDEVGFDLAYDNGVSGIHGRFGTNDSNSFIEHSDGITYDSQIKITETIKFTADGLETDSQDIPITVKVVLTQTELSTFGTVPIEVVPAPGAGKGIQPISAYAEYEYGGTAYANFGIPGLTHNPSSGSLPLKTTVTLLDQTVNYVRFFMPTDEGYNAGFTIDNQPLYFTDDDGSDPTAGDGTLTLYVTYKIIKL